MNELRRDIISNTFYNNVKITDSYMFITDGNFIFSEKSKKYFLGDYAKSNNEEYNDFNFIILGMYIDFKKKIFHMNFVLGSVSLYHEVAL